VKTTDEEQTTKHCGHAGAHYLVSVIEPNDTIGISWGKTIAPMFNQYLPVSFPDVTVIPLVGSIGSEVKILGNQLAADLAASLHSKYKLLHTPAFVSGKKERELIMNDPSTRDHIIMTENVDIAVFTLGSLEQAAARSENYISFPITSTSKKRAPWEI
jgi:DNA-binding transcriptional regulator LsrR (DeoR family)